MPQVTVIIPCYNQGQYVEDAVASVLAQTFKDLEIIIVNDGSTDAKTNELLGDYNKAKVRVVTTSNQGLASARNNGIKEASGKYILPLDADDTIKPSYIEKAVHLLETRNELGIVYCEATLFGAVETKWKLPGFSLKEMLLDNVIFCSAMFRKADWLSVDGYDPGMVYGWEDYDFWLSLIENGCEVYQIPEVLFSYRVASDSMVRSKERWQKVAMFKRIFERHPKLFADNIDVWINSLLDLREKYFTSKLYIDIGNGINEETCLSRKVDKETVKIVFSFEDFERIDALRFDPVDVPAVIEIFEIILEEKNGKCTGLSQFSDNSIGREGATRYFDTNDPNCFLDLNTAQLQNLKSITITLSFTALAADALQEIVQFQKVQIELLGGEKRDFSGGGIKSVGKALQKQVDKIRRRA